jgi:hypothetical protein
VGLEETSEVLEQKGIGPLNIEEALDWAIGNIMEEGFTDIFSEGLEVDLLWDERFCNEIRDFCSAKLKKHNISHISAHEVQNVLIPKGRVPFDYRRASILSPENTLYFLALSIYVAPKIEERKIPVEENRVFSHRFFPHMGKLFREDCGYSSWVEEYLRRKKFDETRVIVKCDIRPNSPKAPDTSMA